MNEATDGAYSGGWRARHGERASVFEHPDFGRIEIADPIRRHWLTHFEQRLGRPLDEQKTTRVAGKEYHFVPFEHGAIFLDVALHLFFEVHRGTQDLIGALAANLGRWAQFGSSVVATHAALLHTNEVLLFSYDSTPGAPYPTADGEWSLVNLFNGEHSPVAKIGNNLFCGGHCLLGDGRVLVVGGERNNEDNLRAVYVFDPISATWHKKQRMTTSRWYPHVVAVAPNVGLAVGGDDKPNNETTIANVSAEYVDPNAAREEPRPFGPLFPGVPDGSGFTAQYPFVFALPNRKTLIHYRRRSYLLPPGQFDFALAEQSDDDSTDRTAGVYGTAVMLPLRPSTNPPYRARIFVAGGLPPSDPRLPSTAAILDTEARPLRWRQVAPLRSTRNFCDSVLLPDGTVLIVNGTPRPDKEGRVSYPEIFDPKTETWQYPRDEAEIPRGYHSVALLLPDGRVLTGGTDRVNNPGNEDRRRLETYSPPYLFRGVRPVIRSAPSEITFGSTFDVETLDANAVASAVIIRNGTCTHSFNSDQRFIELEITRRVTWPIRGSKPQPSWLPRLLPLRQRVELRAPPHRGIAPVGYYMLFLVTADGVPSVARFVRCRDRYSTQERLSGFVQHVARATARLLSLITRR